MQLSNAAVVGVGFRMASGRSAGERHLSPLRDTALWSWASAQLVYGTPVRGAPCPALALDLAPPFHVPHPDPAQFSLPHVNFLAITTTVGPQRQN